jgi:two-component system, cell cycle sensor histidine kinase and response regulator CckA
VLPPGSDRPEFEEEASTGPAARLLAQVDLERRYYQELFAALPVAAAVFGTSFGLLLANREFRKRFHLTGEDLTAFRLEYFLPGPEAEKRAREVLESGVANLAWRVELPSEAGSIPSLVSMLRSHNWEQAESRELLVLVLESSAATTTPARPPGRSIAAAVAAAVAGVRDAPVNPPQPSRRISDKLDVVFWEMDPKTSRFRTVSPRAQELTGIRREEWRTPSEFSENFVHPLDRQSYLDFYSGDMASRSAGSIEYRVLLSRGPSRWLRDTVRPVSDDLGRLESLAGMTQDVSERRRVEQDRVDAGKREGIERLAGRVAHVANNLLMIIGGYGEDLLASLDPDDPRRADVEEILKASGRLGNLTRELTDINRPCAPDEVPLELNEWATAFADRLRAKLPPDQAVDLMRAAKPVIVHAPAAVLDRFFEEALRTAKVALPPQGRLMLEILPSREAGNARISLRLGGADLEAELRERFFEPFAGPKEAGKDPPLGLAALHRPLAANGISARLEGEPGEDPRIVLAMAQYEEAAAPQTVEAPAAAATAGATILLVEDEASIRSLVRKSLRREGYDVLDAGTTEDSLAVARNHEGSIDLLITDVLVPLVNGRVLAEALTHERPNLKVLFISGHTENVVLPEDVPFLRKPFTLGALLERVRDLLAPPRSHAAGAT